MTSPRAGRTREPGSTFSVSVRPLNRILYTFTPPPQVFDYGFHVMSCMLGNKLVSSGPCDTLLEFAVEHLLSLRCGYARLTEPLGGRRAGAAHAWRNVRIAASWQLSMPGGTVGRQARSDPSWASKPHGAHRDLTPVMRIGTSPLPAHAIYVAGRTENGHARR